MLCVQLHIPFRSRVMIATDHISCYPEHNFLILSNRFPKPVNSFLPKHSYTANKQKNSSIPAINYLPRYENLFHYYSHWCSDPAQRGELNRVTNREFTTEDPAVRPKGTISVYYVFGNPVVIHMKCLLLGVGWTPTPSTDTSPHDRIKSRRA